MRTLSAVVFIAALVSAATAEEHEIKLGEVDMTFFIEVINDSFFKIKIETPLLPRLGTKFGSNLKPTVFLGFEISNAM